MTSNVAKKWFAKCPTTKVLHLISFSQKVDKRKRTIKKFFQELLFFFCQLFILKNHNIVNSDHSEVVVVKTTF